MWDLIVSVPDHCLSFHSVYSLCGGGTSSQRNIPCVEAELQDFKSHNSLCVEAELQVS